MKSAIIGMFAILFYSVGLSIYTFVILAVGSTLFSFPMPDAKMTAYVLLFSYVTIMSYNQMISGLASILAQKEGKR